MKSAGAAVGFGLCALVLCACGDAPPETALDAGHAVFGDAGPGAGGNGSADGDRPSPGDSDAQTGAPAGDGALPDDGVSGEPASEDGLPVAHLWVSNDVNPDGYIPARFFYRGREYRDVQAKLRGKTSLMYPKKSFTVKLGKNDLFDEPEHGMRGRRRIVLTTTFDDNSYVRQRLAFALWNRLRPTIEVQAFNAVLYVNGRYHGLYLLGDHVDDERMSDSGLWPGGNLYKARSHDANLRPEDRFGDPKDPLDTGYTKEEGTPEADQPGAFDDLHALITWLASAPDEGLLAQADGVLDRADFEAWRVLVSAIEATDSAGKNGYLYHDPRADAPDPRWHNVPWDFNASFGQNWQTWRTASDRPLSDYDQANLLFERWSAHPQLNEALVRRFRAALAGELSRERVLALFDAYSGEVAAAAQRDEAFWGERMRGYDWAAQTPPFGSHADERGYVRAWIDERWQRLHELLDDD